MKTKGWFRFTSDLVRHWNTTVVIKVDSSEYRGLHPDVVARAILRRARRALALPEDERLKMKGSFLA